MELMTLSEAARAKMDAASKAYIAGDFASAEAGFRSLITDHPDHAPFHSNLGVVLRKSGRIDEAEASYRKAVALAPDSPDARYNLGNLVRDRGQLAEARQLFIETTKRDANHAGAWTNLGGVLRDLELYPESVVALKRALKLDALYADHHNNLAVTLWKMKRFTAAIHHYRRAIDLSPTDTRFISNLGVCYLDHERYDLAEAALRHALTLDPNNVDVLGFLGQSLVGMGRLEDALTLFDQAIAMDQDHLDSNLGRARALLLKGDMANGWPAYAWRWQRTETRDQAVATNQWRGEPLDGKSIHLIPEQGAGDILQFLRYVPILEARGARVSTTVPDALRRISATISPNLTLISENQPEPETDFIAHLLDVPELIGTDLETIPQTCPYLSVPNEVNQMLPRQRGGKLHAGLVWAGNPNHKRDALRSVPLSHMAQLLSVPDVCWYSLQKGDRSADRRDLGLDAVLPDIVAETEDFADTAHLIMQLDLVVTVDTSVAHLAGALGKPVWVLVQYAPDWRWLLDRTDTPWYPSMRLFRMGKHQDLSELRAALIERTTG
jgi:Flp pilus assembly protein TadD